MQFNLSVPKRLLYLTEQGITAYRWEQKTLQQEARFSITEAGDLEAFENYLRSSRRIPIFIIVDIIELDFRFEIIPHVNFKEAKALRARKLNAAYRSTPFRHVLELGREPDGRKDDRVLLSAITNADALSPWLPAMSRLRSPVAGICSPPLLLAKAVKEWPTEHTLLITFATTKAIRLTYFHKNDLRFSRLAIHYASTIEGIAPIIIEETSRTQQYLINLKLLGRDDQLQVIILDQEQQIDFWEKNLPSTRLLNFTAQSFGTLAQKSRYPKILAPCKNTEELLVTLTTIGIASNHYANLDHLHEAFLRLLRVSLHGAAIAGLTLTLGLLGAEAYSLWGIFQHTEEASHLIQQTANKYRGIKEAFPPSPADAPQMLEAVEITTKLSSHRYPPSELLGTVAMALEQAPTYRLLKINWGYAPSSQTTPAELGTNIRHGANTPTTAPPLPIPGQAEEKVWFAIIIAEPPAEQRQRAALDAVERMTTFLRKKDALTVDVLQLPYSTNPESPLEGSVGIPGVESKRQLVLRIQWPEKGTALRSKE